MYFVLLKGSKFSNFCLISMTNFYFVNTLNDACNLSKMK